MNRRKFLTLMGAAGVASTAAGAACEAEAAGGGNFPYYKESFGVLHDTTRCIGCRRCEMGCQEVNNLPMPKKPLNDLSVLDKPRRTTADAWTVINKYNDGGKPVFRKLQCNHCQDPACAAACFVKAFKKDPTGAVTYDGDLCVGCRYCMVACPFNIPGFQYYEAFDPLVRKCTFCYPRIKQGLLPGCVQACPMDALIFGKREDIMRLAKNRVAQDPKRYVQHVYGEKEAGGTAWVVISGAPFGKLGLDENMNERPYAELTAGALGAVPMVIGLWPILLGGAYLITKRSEKVAKEEQREAVAKAVAEVREQAEKEKAEAVAAARAEAAKNAGKEEA